MNVPSFSRVLTAFAIVSVLGIVFQVDTAGGGDDQKADTVPADAATSSLPSPDLAAVKAAIALARKGELAQASDVKESMSDPIARNVVEWAILRSDNKEVDFRRYVAFISDHPSWPNIGSLRRRAETASAGRDRCRRDESALRRAAARRAGGALLGARLDAPRTIHRRVVTD